MDTLLLNFSVALVVLSTLKIDSRWEFAVWLRELKQGLCNNLEEDGERDGREGIYVYLWVILICICQKPKNSVAWPEAKLWWRETCAHQDPGERSNDPTRNIP